MPRGRRGILMPQSLEHEDHEIPQSRHHLRTGTLADPVGLLAKRPITDAMQAVLDGPGTMPSKEQVVSRRPDLADARSGGQVIRGVDPVLLIRPDAHGGSTIVGIPPTSASAPARPRPTRSPAAHPGPRPGGRAPGPSSATRAACAARGPWPPARSCNQLSPGDKASVPAAFRGTRGRNPRSCSNRRTIPAVNREARLGGRKPPASRAAAISFGVSPRSWGSASRDDIIGQAC